MMLENRQLSIYLSLYTAWRPYERYPQVYFVHSGLEWKPNNLQ